MRSNHALQLSYQRYDSSKEKHYLFEPYCLKMHSRRWYVVGRFVSADKVNVISLDRVKAIDVTEETFELPTDFNAEEFFSESFGVIVDDGTYDEPVVVRVYGSVRNYIEDLPLHHSQVLIRQTEDYSDYQFYIRPTIDFLRILMGFGDELVVLKPQGLGEMLQEWHVDSANAYSRVKRD